jgi:uncharacterized Zn finger protein (UPF0148 family)
VAPVVELNRSLEQELFALLRGASLECLVCGEFVLHLPDGSIFCPECGCALARPAELPEAAGTVALPAKLPIAGRVTAG